MLLLTEREYVSENDMLMNCNILCVCNTNLCFDLCTYDCLVNSFQYMYTDQCLYICVC